jgi:phage gp46-like protein
MTDAFSDIKVFYNEFNTYGFFDLRIGANDFEIDATGLTSSLISEFSDRRVDEDDARDGYRGGWWGAEVMGIDPKQWGSRRWILYNKRLDKNTLRLWEQYTEEAYKWQIENGTIISVSCEAVKGDTNRLDYTVTRIYPNNETVKTQKSVVWEQK